MDFYFFVGDVLLIKLQLSGEGLMQQRLLQSRQRGVLPLVEAGEALGLDVGRGLGVSGCVLS